MRNVSGLLLPFGVKVDRRWYMLSFADTAFDEFLEETREEGRDVCWITDSHRLTYGAVVAAEHNGSLRFEKSDAGLRWAADIVEADDEGKTQTAAQATLLAMLDQGLGRCVSAGTLIHDIAWHNLGEDDEYAEVTKASLYEMSSVPMPAFTEAKADTYAALDADGRSTLKSVTEFAQLDENGKRVDFDFAASRQAAIDAQAQTQSEPVPETEPAYQTQHTVAELRERYGVPNGESG